MTSLALVFTGLVFVGLGYAHHARPATMFKIYNWPLSAGQEVGDGAKTTYQRRGYIFIVLGSVTVLWALFAP